MNSKLSIFYISLSYKSNYNYNYYKFYNYPINSKLSIFLT